MNQTKMAALTLRCTYRRLRLTYGIAAFLAFLAGVIIYVFFRNPDIVLFQIIPKPAFFTMRNFSVSADTVPMSMLLFNVPDGLWFLSGLLAIRAVWLTNQKWRLIYFVLFMVIAFTMEISQIFEGVAGTFDVFDMVFMAFFAFVESIIFNIFIRRSV